MLLVPRMLTSFLDPFRAAHASNTSPFIKVPLYDHDHDHDHLKELNLFSDLDEHRFLIIN